MKKILKLLFLIFGSFIGLLTILFVCLMILMPVAKKEVFTDDNLSKYPSPLHTEKNKIVNLAGETVLLKGLMVPELQKLNYEGNFKECFFEEGLTKQTYLSGNRTTYGEPLANYMEENGIGWIACWYDDGWEPPMFLDERTELTDWGQFVMELLKE